jgi:hypothetical protein
MSYVLFYAWGVDGHACGLVPVLIAADLQMTLILAEKYFFYFSERVSLNKLREKKLFAKYRWPDKLVP